MGSAYVLYRHVSPTPSMKSHGRDVLLQTREGGRRYFFRGNLMGIANAISDLNIISCLVHLCKKFGKI